MKERAHLPEISKALVQLRRLINKLAILSSAARHTSSCILRLFFPPFLCRSLGIFLLPSFPKERRDFWIEQTRARTSVKNDAIFAARLP